MALEALPEIVGIGLGHPPALAVLAWWDGRQLLLAAGEEIAVALAQVLVLGLRELFAFALGYQDAGLLEQALDVRRPAVGVGLDDEGQLAQQMRAAQAVAAVIVGEIRGPAVMDDGPAIAGNDVDRLDGLAPALGVEELPALCSKRTSSKISRLAR
jgi:hypothetical protein